MKPTGNKYDLLDSIKETVKEIERDLDHDNYKVVKAAEELETFAIYMKHMMQDKKKK